MMRWVVIGAGLGVVAFALSAGLCGLVRRFAEKLGFLDRPGGRKAHANPTPLGGGVAIWASVMLSVGLAGLAAWLARPWLSPSLQHYIDGAWLRSGHLALILGLSTVIMVMGLVDDRVGLSWKPRILIQLVLAAVFVASGEQATLFSPFRVVTGAITVLWVVGLTNAFNFLDNMDALSASVGLIASMLFVGAQVAVGSLFVPALLLVLSGALAGFLVHNRPPARLFMGDAGSNFLGFLLGTLTVAGTFTREEFSRFGVLTPLLVMAVPLYDTTSVILIRLREGRSPFQADRRHFSHRLVDRGLTPGRAVATIDLVTLAAGLGALLLHRLGSVWEAAVVAGQTVCLLGVVAILEMMTPGPEPRSDAQATAQAVTPEELTNSIERADGVPGG